MKISVHVLRTVGLAVFISCASRTGRAQEGKSFPLPSARDEQVWEAEDAARDGDWVRVSHSWASAGAYVEPRGLGKGTALVFPFTLRRPTTLRIRPIWWRHGERKPARRFPHPLRSAVGPDVMDWCGRLVFFTCPRSGRVGVLDAASESVVKALDLGGYPADIVADRELGRIYVADAKGDRVVVIDAKTQQQCAEIPVPACPWSLTLHGEKLCVACRKARLVAVIDRHRGVVTNRLPTGAEPVHVEIVGGESPRIAARVMPMTFDLRTFDEMAPDKDSCAFPNRASYDAAGPWFRVARIHSPRPELLRFDMGKNMRTRYMSRAWRKRPRESWTIDIASVTKLPEPARALPSPMRWQAGVSAIDAYPRMQQKRTPTGARTGCPGEDVLLFTASAAGRVGVVNLDRPEPVKAIDLGGYLADLVVDQDSARAYVADALGDRVVVLNAKDGKRLGEIRVEGMPWSLDVCGGTLFVGCRKSKSLAVIDTARNCVVRTTNLGAEPLQVSVQQKRMIASPNISKPDRLAVKLPTVAFDAASLERVSAQGLPERFRRRTEARVSWTMAKTQKLPSAERSPGLAASYGFWDNEAHAKRAGKKHRNVTVGKSDCFGAVLELNGRALVDCGNDPSLMPTEALTVEAWVRWDGPGRSAKGDKGDFMSCIVGNRGLNSGYMLTVMKDGKAVFDINGLRKGQDLDFTVLTSNLRTERGKWAHIAGVYDSKGPSMAVYVNGVGKTQRGMKPMHPSTSRLAIGAQRADGPYYWFKGAVAQVRIHSRALDATEIRARYERLVPERTKSFSCDNLLTVRVDGQRWVDVTGVADPQAMPPRPISPGDQPGTITLAVDDGPAYDWTRNIWLTPDQGVLLQNGTQEFWRWNAPTFTLPPGAHVLKVRADSQYACLDGLEVTASRAGEPSLALCPEPADNWWAFYHDEPVRFQAEIATPEDGPRKATLRYAVDNYMGERVADGERDMALAPGRKCREQFELKLKDTGRFTLKATVRSLGQEVMKQWYFLRVPRLEHPRLLFRRDSMPQIRERIAQHPRLFERFAGYLHRRCSEVGFLPKGVTLAELGGRQERTYLLAWRMLACQFAAMFLERPGERFFASKVERLLVRTPPYYDMAHFHQSHFPGATASLLDLASMDDAGVSRRLHDLFDKRIGISNVLPQGLAVFEEPLDAGRRAILSQVMMWMFNIERYFQAHAGRRGGNWWVSPWTGCHCPLNGPGLSFFYLRNFLGEKRIFEKTCFSGFYTHHRYLSPTLLNKWGGLGCGGPPGFPPTRGLPGPQGTPNNWILSLLGKHPIMLEASGWKKWVQEMNGKLDEPAEKHVDALCDAEVAVAIPIALAAGWYCPEDPAADQTELPPTMLFDGEGDVSMRAGGTEDGTFVYFTSGARDVVYRNQPNHFQVYRGSQPLIGTGSLWADDVNSVPSWGNVVVVDTEWRDKWRMNVGVDHFRAGERFIINRYPPAFREYGLRDQRLTKYRPAHGGVSFLIGWSPLGFHQHQDDLFLKEGDIAAYETWPEFDYVAGDATNAWPLRKVKDAYRQLVFVKPDVIAVYDRLILGPDARDTRWLAATQPTLAVNGSEFHVSADSSALRGTVVLPEDAALEVIDPSTSRTYRGLFYGPKQKLLVIRAPSSEKVVEYLVVMRVGAETIEPLAIERILDEQRTGVELSSAGKTVRLTFRRTGPVGGHITIPGGRRPIDCDFVERVDDTYRHWQTDTRYKRWLRDPRFRCIVGFDEGE